MKEKYENPAVDIVSIEETDIIFASEPGCGEFCSCNAEM